MISFKKSIALFMLSITGLLQTSDKNMFDALKKRKIVRPLKVTKNNGDTTFDRDNCEREGFTILEKKSPVARTPKALENLYSAGFGTKNRYVLIESDDQAERLFGQKVIVTNLDTLQDKAFRFPKDLANFSSICDRRNLILKHRLNNTEHNLGYIGNHDDHKASFNNIIVGLVCKLGLMTFPLKQDKNDQKMKILLNYAIPAIKVSKNGRRFPGLFTYGFAGADFPFKVPGKNKTMLVPAGTCNHASFVGTGFSHDLLYPEDGLQKIVTVGDSDYEVYHPKNSVYVLPLITRALQNAIDKARLQKALDENN